MNIVFKKGLPGFEYLHKFKLLKVEENEKFKVLQSEEDEISFITVSPFDIYNDYEVDLDDETINDLNIENPEDVLILSIITIGKTLEETTMNLKAPVVINIKNNLAKQYILQSEKYETKHPLVRREKDASNY